MSGFQQYFIGIYTVPIFFAIFLLTKLEQVPGGAPIPLAGAIS